MKKRKEPKFDRVAEIVVETHHYDEEKYVVLRKTYTDGTRREVYLDYETVAGLHEAFGRSLKKWDVLDGTGE